MLTNLNNLLAILTAILPFLFAWLAMTLYGVLSQAHWNDTAKEMMADGFIVLAALACAYSVACTTGYLAVFLAPVAMIGTYYFAKESDLLKHWSLILQEGFFVIRDGKVYLFGIQLPPQAQAITSVAPLAPFSGVGQMTQPLPQVKPSQDDSTTN